MWRKSAQANANSAAVTNKLFAKRQHSMELASGVASQRGMKSSPRCFILRALTWLSVAAVLAPQTGLASGELAQYVAEPDASYGWREVSSGHIGSAEYRELILTSQTWRSVPWKHQLVVIRPATLEPSSKQAFLFIHGGRWKVEYDAGQTRLPREARLFERLANTLRAPVAVLRQVPFQPLFERHEDALIAYTFDRYLDSGEPDWPLLLPMVKSAARGMDAVQALARERWNLEIDSFTVAGASKRGWTSWLTAAIDPRVASVAPMVIDMLNLPEQITLQRQTFGELSEEVRDYADIDLPGRVDTERGRKLLEIVDPYSYRDTLTLPKLIVLGTNDRYWPLEALKLYWNELPEPKRVLYVPNQGHGVADVDRLIGALSALHRYSSRGESLPQVSWEFTGNTESVALAVTTQRPPRRVTAWTATSASRDFRDSRWSAQPCRRTAGSSYTCKVPGSGSRYSAVYAEAEFQDRDAPRFSLSTTVCVLAPGDTADGC
jgi:PhoPQ-activated pathogenicity-related protein